MLFSQDIGIDLGSTNMKVAIYEKDFRLIDYTLLCGAVGLDAVAGLSNKK